MTTDKREHKVGDEILLAGSASRTVGERLGVLPLPAAASCNLTHAHLHSVTLKLLDSIVGRFKLLHCQLRPRDTWPCIYETEGHLLRYKEGSYCMGRERRGKHSHWI